MYWQDPEFVLPEEEEIVICLSPDYLGLVKGYYWFGGWYDLSHCPMEVTKWSELPQASGESHSGSQGF